MRFFFGSINSTLYIDISDYEINGIICNPNLCLIISYSCLLKHFTFIKALFFLMNTLCLQCVFSFSDFLIHLTSETARNSCYFTVKCSVHILTMMLTWASVENSLLLALLNFRLPGDLFPYVSAFLDQSHMQYSLSIA